MANAPPRVAELIETFDRNIDAYRSQQYNETQLRREFIDPFFEELGWDVTNIAGNAQAYKDVIHEDAIKIGGATKAPDYSFRIGGVRKFFLEAKKPSIDIKGDPHPAYQLRRYAWSKNLPLSILTDFEEFAVYDCRIRPKQTDKAGTARIIYLKYKDYIEHWDEIANIFSKDAILKGSFDKFAAETKGKRGTTTVDKALLAELEKWRADLARIIALRNRKLSAHEINFAVQRTIDRIIFLRMAEDRGIEPYEQLHTISTGSRTYPRLCELFEKADHKYNSGLFYFQTEPGRPEGPDELTLNLVVDDNPLKYILHSLYYPQCPYEFSVLPPEILGNVYEQFLGSVITISAARRVKIEPKPEVKKAGGVYYTPAYIVDYIVKNTVGRLLECHCEEPALQATRQSQNFLAPSTAGGSPNIPSADPNVIPSEAEGSIKNCHSERSEESQPSIDNRQSKFANQKPLTPKQISKLRVLDPACGSGSFLLGAYTYLLNYHRDWYVENSPEKHTKKIYQGKGGQWFLTIAEKKQILLNNIFGVDIDSQAVEVTKLSLLLKVLEGENRDTVENQFRIFHERALPDLGNNIKCGNSLIDPDFFDDLDVIPPQQSFSRRRNGDAPRHSERSGAKHRAAEESIKNILSDDLRRKINPFNYKTEFPQIFKQSRDRKRAVSSAVDGFNAVIGNPPYGGTIEPEIKEYVSAHYTTAEYQFDTFPLFIEKGLKLLRNNGLWSMIVPNTLALNVRCPNTRRVVLDHRIESVRHFNYKVFPAATVDTEIWTISKTPASSNQIVTVEIIDRDGTIKSFSHAQSTWMSSEYDIFNICIEPAKANLWYHIAKKYPPLKLSAKVTQGCKPFQAGKGKPPQTRKVVEDKPFVSQEKPSEDWRPLLAGKLISRYCIRWKENYWIKFGKWLAEPRLSANFDASEKIVIRQTGDSLIATIDRKKFIVRDNLYTILPISNISCRFLLGLINSKLLNFCYSCINLERGEALAQVKATHLRKLPIRTIDFNNPDDKAKHDKIVKLVDRMLDLHKRLSKAKVPAEKTRIQRQINTTDKQIDKLTYQLYNLTEEEIKIIEKT